ncbi:hypothetical protein Dimus_027727 [Dionaea muscipula]
MMAGNPDSNWWSMPTAAHAHNQLPPDFLSQTPPIFPLQYFHGSSSPVLPSNFHPLLSTAADGQDFPLSWSQLLMGGLASTSTDHQGDYINYRSCPISHYQPRKFETNWDDHDHHVNPISADDDDHVKEEHITNISQGSNRSYGHGHGHGHDHDHEVVFVAARGSTAFWPHQFLPASSPKSCITSLSSCSSSSILDFSNTSCKAIAQRNQHAADHNSSECNSTVTGAAASKKARIRLPSTPPLKVRKEKLGDRITALHQLVSPFGKTDTASVLLEAIGYIRFLQAQIEALSSPYLGNASDKNQHYDCMMGDAPKDLRSRGLCIVPISGTQIVASDINAANYWASSSFNGGL